MSAGKCGVGDDNIVDEDARKELANLLSDHRFHATERQKSILAYLVEQHLSSEDDETVKAYSIAVDVLRRPTNFDASIDPIVRIEMSRLRSSLSNYYEAYGDRREIWIDVTRGRYAVTFERKAPRRAEPDKNEGNKDAAKPASDVSATAPPGRAAAMTIVWTASILLVSLVAGVTFAAFKYLDGPAMTARPTLSLLVVATDDTTKQETDRLQEALVIALNRFQTLQVGDGAGHRGSRESVDPLSHRYKVDIRYFTDPSSGRSIWWQIVEEASGTVLKSANERIEDLRDGDISVEQQVAGILAVKLAATDSAINANERKRAGRHTVGNSCLLKAEYQLDQGRGSDIADVEACLERAVRRDPDDADANSLLARVLVFGRGAATGGETKARALDLAYAALSSAPNSDRSHLGLMISQFAAGYVDAAIDAGRRARSLNPYNPSVQAKLAMILYTQGRWEEGLALASTADGSERKPKDALLVLALDAYQRGDWSNASLLAEQIDCDDVAVHALRAAAQAQLAPASAKQRLADIRAAHPDFEITFYEELAERRFDPRLVSALEGGLVKAGASLVPCTSQLC